MIMGADVTHPNTSNYMTPMSLASLVGSYDKDCTKYHAVTRVQKKNKQEIITDLKDMAYKLLRNYFELNSRTLPLQIIFYRDGVSDGQLKDCLDQELRQLQEACKSIPVPGWNPKITVIVVQKRHHTRFRPEDPRDGVGKDKNIGPGTVVEKSVVHPKDFDFFLCSHAGIQGTSRPTHYYVIHDDNKLSADELQKLTFYMCHVYAKCPRSISIPAPVMYAHLVAYRARVHVDATGSDINSTVSSVTDEAYQLEVDEMNKRILVGPATKNAMYFC